MLGMRKDCQVLIHVDVEQALAGQIPKFGIVTHSSISRRNWKIAFRNLWAPKFMDAIFGHSDYFLSPAVGVCLLAVWNEIYNLQTR